MSNANNPWLVMLLLLSVPFWAACGSGSARDQEAAGDVAETDEQEQGAAAERSEAVVTLTEAAARTAALEVTVAEQVTAPFGSATGAIPAQVEFDPARVALVSPRAAGRIERLLVVEGDAVRAGEPVAYLLSTAFLTAQDDLVQAVRRARLLEGTADEEGATALVDAAVRRLRLMGVDPPLIDRIAQEGMPEDFLPVNAPFSGRIVEAHALVGAAVEPGSPIFTLVDLSVVNVAAEVPEWLLPRVRRGQAVAVRLAAYPDVRLAGRVTRIKDQLDRETRTATALIEVSNPEGLLRPGMFASVELRTARGEAAGAPRAVIIPASAVVMDGAERYAFVEVGERTYERRAVVVSSLAGDEDRVIVHSGVDAGERVVARGAFTLKAELDKSALGEEHSGTVP